VGSDLDLVIVINESNSPFNERPLHFDSPDLPVPAEMLVYTAAEWDQLMSNPYGSVTCQKESALVVRAERRVGCQVLPIDLESGPTLLHSKAWR
jgi:hypothetical protein